MSPHMAPVGIVMKCDLVSTGAMSILDYINHPRIKSASHLSVP